MGRIAILTLVLTLGGAQTRTPVPAPVDHMHIKVEADRIRIGTEWMPRFLDLPRVLVVPKGETTTLAPDSTWDYIEVAGTLRAARDADTTLRFTHLVVLPGGVLDAGTPEDPIRGRVEFVIRNVPIDTARDPFQWGNGLLNFGTMTRVGLAKTPFVELTGDAAAGATTLTLAEAPEGWNAGDELVLPDTRQTGWVNRQESAPRRDVPTAIRSIEGTTVTLTAPLGFARQAIRDPDGGVVLRPRVANLTRNIVIRSENPEGVRGHVATVGPDAAWDVGHGAFVGLGRTKNEPIDSATPDGARAGANQIGRYPDHYHHVRDAARSRTIGNVYRGDGRSKWALAIHQTDGALVEDNVCIDTAGACFVTEDGNEARNVFRRNFAAYVVASGLAINRTQEDMDRNCPGCEGVGFWFRGVHQTIESNEAWNNAQGMNLVLRVAGIDEMKMPASLHVPVGLRGNVTASNRVSGLEYWGMPRFPADDHIAAHNGLRQFSITGPPGNNAYLRNMTAVASEARSTCLEGSVGYVPTIEVDGGRMLGCRVGAADDGIAIEYATFRNVVMQNVTNFYAASSPYAVTFENVIHKPLGNFPKRYIVFGQNADVWTPDQPLPRGAMYLWGLHRGSRHKVINWQGTGKDYVLLLPGQRASAPAWPSYNGLDFYDLVPEAGLTMGQAWQKYGMALKGDVSGEESDGVILEGLVNGIAREGLETRLGTPKAVLSNPNMLGPPQIENGQVKMYFVLTGERGIATDFACYRINDRGPTCTNWVHFQDVVHAKIPLGEFTPGVQTVTTWRQTPKGAKVAGSEMTFQFRTGPPPAPPAPK